GPEQLRGRVALSRAVERTDRGLDVTGAKEDRVGARLARGDCDPRGWRGGVLPNSMGDRLAVRTAVIGHIELLDPQRAHLRQLCLGLVRRVRRDSSECAAVRLE